MTATLPSISLDVDAAVRVFELCMLAEECIREGAPLYAFDAMQTATVEEPAAMAVISCVGAQSLRRFC